jgi:predicted ArsR family transcriptional regulator
VESSKREEVAEMVRKFSGDEKLREEYQKRARAKQEELRKLHAAEVSELRERLLQSVHAAVVMPKV